MMTELACRSVGRGAHPVVLVHGWSADSRIWSPMMAAYHKSASFRAPDLPGHGATPLHMDGLGLDAYHGVAVSRFCSWCEAEGLSEAPMAAWAWGTWVVLEGVSIGRLSPASLFLVATAPSSESPDPYSGPIARDWPRYVQALVRMMVREPISPETERWLTRIMRSTSLAAAAGIHQATWQPPGGEFRLPPHSRLVVGDQDPVQPGDAGVAMASSWGVSRVHRVAGAGHTPFLEARSEFRETFEGWLRDIGADA